LLKASLPGEGRGCEQLAIDPADEFQSQPLMQLREIHAVEVAKELYTPEEVFAERQVRDGDCSENPRWEFSGCFRVTSGFSG
jgi:hypothetical protein